MTGTSITEEGRKRLSQLFKKFPLTKEELTMLYWEKGLSTIKIGKRRGICDRSVRRWMTKYGIPKRTQSESMSGERHHYHGKKLSSEHIRKMIQSSKGQRRSPRTEIKKGQRLSPNTEFKKGMIPKSRKTFVSKEFFEDLYYNQGLSTIEIGKRIGLAAKNVQQWFKKFGIPIRTLSEARKLAFTTGRVKNNPPTKPELEFEQLCLKFSLPFKYVGDGSFWIGRLNPDFIHKDGEKIAVEIFGDYWHNPKKRELSYSQTEDGRQTILAEHGWKLAVIWEHEVHDIEKVLNKVMEVCN